MARTIRRRHCRYDYHWVLRDWTAGRENAAWAMLAPRSQEGRRALVRYHSDATITMRKTAPRWYRKVYDAKLKNRNRAMPHCWLRNPDFEPVFQDWHKHDANWSWW